MQKQEEYLDYILIGGKENYSGYDGIRYCVGVYKNDEYIFLP